MKLYACWGRAERSFEHRGRWLRFSCWRGSDASESDARSLAESALGRLQAHFLAQGRIEPYAYADRPLREEVLQRIDEGLAITRNRYGAPVLNSASRLFIDVDVAAGGGWFGGAKRAFAKALARIEESAQRFDAHRFRVYRTRAGYRLLLCDRAFDPRSAESDALLEAFGADPLYRKLCRVQECYRARLGPKPWRIGLRSAAEAFPRPSPESEQRQREWLARYEAKARGFAVCELVAEFGGAPIGPEALAVVALHDRFCLAPGQPLA